MPQIFVEIVQSFVGKDEAYPFINTIKGTPEGWKNFDIYYNIELEWLAVEWTTFDNCRVKRRSVAAG